MRRLTILDVRMLGDAGLRLNRKAWHCTVLHSILLKSSTVLCCTVLCIAEQYIILIIKKIIDIEDGQRNDGQPCVLFRYIHFDLYFTLPPYALLHSFYSLTTTLFNSYDPQFLLSFIISFLPWSIVDQILYLHFIFYMFLNNIRVKVAICIDMVSQITSGQRL